VEVTGMGREGRLLSRRGRELGQGEKVHLGRLSSLVEENDSIAVSGGWWTWTFTTLSDGPPLWPNGRKYLNASKEILKSFIPGEFQNLLEVETRFHRHAYPYALVSTCHLTYVYSTMHGRRVDSPPKDLS
jgi:hypothetical protein